MANRNRAIALSLLEDMAAGWQQQQQQVGSDGLNHSEQRGSAQYELSRFCSWALGRVREGNKLAEIGGCKSESPSNPSVKIGEARQGAGLYVCFTGPMATLFGHCPRRLWPLLECRDGAHGKEQLKGAAWLSRVCRPFRDWQ